MTPGDHINMPNGQHFWNGERFVPPWEWEMVAPGKVEMPTPTQVTLAFDDNYSSPLPPPPPPVPRWMGWLPSWLRRRVHPSADDTLFITREWADATRQQ